MTKLKYSISILLILITFCSCFVRAPRYTTLDRVFALRVGMTKEEVSRALNSKPYNLKLLTDTATILLYKYRVNDRATFPFLLKENNGKQVLGNYANLLVTYNKKGVSTKIENCTDCDLTTVEEKKLDINKIVTFLTVTLPVVLVFLGIKFGVPSP